MLAYLCVGLLLGLPLAASLLGCLAFAQLSVWQDSLIPQLVLFVPLWLGAVIAPFGFRTPRRAAFAYTLAIVVLQLSRFALLQYIEQT